MRWSYEDFNSKVDTYEDMIDMKYPYESKHPRMSLYNRAAQFSPFAALTGHEEAIDETGRLTDSRIELSEESKQEINQTLIYMQEHLSDDLEVLILYFVPDKKKTGGSYQSHIGKIRRIDEIESMLIMKDKKKIKIQDIIEMTILIQENKTR